MDASILWKEIIAGGGTWSHILKRGTSVRLIDMEGGANVSGYFLNAILPAERFNLPDTLKAQHTAKLTRGHVLMSDMGRILCSITEDSVGWHDPIAGCSNAALVAQKYGAADYQEYRNSWHQNAYDGILIELAKYGLEARDLQATVNFFSKVTVADDGSMLYEGGHSSAGGFVELRAEMDTLVILNTCQHPLDPSAVYAPRPVELVISKVPRSQAEDFCFNCCAENGRAWSLTERYLS